MFSKLFKLISKIELMQEDGARANACDHTQGGSCVLWVDDRKILKIRISNSCILRRHPERADLDASPWIETIS